MVTTSKRDSWNSWEVLLPASVAFSIGAIHSLAGGAFLIDDWTLLNNNKAEWSQAIDIRFRPIQWLTHLLQYETLGQHAWLHALLLGIVAAVVAAALSLAVRRNVSPQLGWTTAILWACYPAISSIRYWNATLPILLALLMLLIGWTCSADLRRSVWPTTALAALSLLTYEAGFGLAIALVALACYRRSLPYRSWLTPFAILLVTITWNRVTSPKSGPDLDGGTYGDIPRALFGDSLTPTWLGPVWIVFVLAPILVVGARLWLGPEVQLQFVAHGAVMIALGISIMATVGFPLVSVGLLDRANVMAAPGVALLLAAIAQQLGPLVWRRGDVAIVAATALVFFVSTIEIGASARRAEDDLRQGLLVASDYDEDTVIELPNRQNYSGATYAWSIEQAAIVLGYETGRLGTDVQAPADFSSPIRVIVSDQTTSVATPADS